MVRIKHATDYTPKRLPLALKEHSDIFQKNKNNPNSSEPKSLEASGSSFSSEGLPQTSSGDSEPSSSNQTIQSGINNAYASESSYANYVKFQLSQNVKIPKKRIHVPPVPLYPWESEDEPPPVKKVLKRIELNPDEEDAGERPLNRYFFAYRH